MQQKTWPTLYKKAKTGKVQEWTISVQETGSGYGQVTVKHGTVTGKKQLTQKVIKSGKNVGKKNETTPFAQALSESFSKWKKQIDRGYTEDTSGVSSVVLPMLAKEFQKVGQKIKYPCYVQPKLNGVRCLAYRNDNGKVVLKSRLGKDYTKNLPHIVNSLETVLNHDDILDGELYVHGWTFQEIIRSVKKLRPESSHKIEYWLYDMADTEMPFARRTLYLSTITNWLTPHTFKRLNTHRITAEKGVKLWHRKWVEDGFEGIIIRNADSKYEMNTRSYNLQKYKEFHDKEVLIIGCKEGIGLEAGCVVWRVRDEFGNIFWSRPRGSRDLRKKWFQEATKHIGKELTIRYQELSEDNVPVFNVGIAMRDYE